LPIDTEIAVSALGLGLILSPVFVISIR